MFLRSLARPADASASATSPPPKRFRRRLSRGPGRKPGLELLEDRCLLSTWEPVGPAPILNGNVPGNQPLAGRITGIAADPTDAKTFYIAAAGGGVWKTGDGGASWTPLTDNQATVVMGAIAVDPGDPNVLYAGTGEANGISVDFIANYSPTTFYGRGVLKSTDGGKSWTLLGNDVFDRRSIAKVVIDPKDADVAYVAVGQPGFNGLPGNQGIWQTTDGGKTWVNGTAASGIRDDLAFSDLVMDPGNDQHLYAVVGDPHGSIDNGLYETTDAGKTWFRSTGGGTFPASARVGRIALAISPSNPLRLYAALTIGGSLGGGGLYAMLRTDDGGAHWTTLARVPNYLGGQGNYDTALAVDPSDPDRVYAAGQGGTAAVIESTNAGFTWSEIAVGASGDNGPHNDHHALAFDAKGGLLDGTDGGIWRLDDPTVGEIHWTDLNTNLQITTLVGIALHPTDPTIAYGGSQDTGTEKFTGDPAWTEVRPNDGGHVRVDPDNPDTVYHQMIGTSGSTFERSDDGGKTWQTKTTGIGSLGGNFFPPLVLDPSNPTRLLLGTTRVFETTNRADNWVPLSTPGVAGWTVGDPIDSVAVAPSSVDTIYASAGGHIFVTFNHGVTWKQRDVPGYADHFFDLQVDPTNPKVAYAVRGLFGGGHVFRTADGGKTWVDISGNLPDLPAFSLQIGPGVLYLGTDAGVYFTTDRGRHRDWEPFGDGFPNAEVKELVLNTKLNILAAATHGRGMWEISLDDSGSRNGRTRPERQGAEMASALRPPVAPPAGLERVSTSVVTFQTGGQAALGPAGVDGFFASRPAEAGAGTPVGPTHRPAARPLPEVGPLQDLLALSWE